MVFVSRFLILGFLFVFLNGFSLHAKSISELSAYPDFCRLASAQEEVFTSFKRHPVYNKILEHSSYEQGLEYLKIIKENYPDPHQFSLNSFL